MLTRAHGEGDDHEDRARHRQDEDPFVDGQIEAHAIGQHDVRQDQDHRSDQERAPRLKHRLRDREEGLVAGQQVERPEHRREREDHDPIGGDGAMNSHAVISTRLMVSAIDGGRMRRPYHKCRRSGERNRPGDETKRDHRHGDGGNDAAPNQIALGVEGRAVIEHRAHAETDADDADVVDEGVRQTRRYDPGRLTQEYSFSPPTSVTDIVPSFVAVSL